MKRALALFCLVVLLCGAAMADKFALVNGGSIGTYTTINAYVGVGGNTLTNIDALNSTPTLAQLAGYDAVLVVSTSGFNDPTALGNVLKQYADAGGGVVIDEYSFVNKYTWALQGGIMGVGYSPFTAWTPPTGAYTEYAKLNSCTVAELCTGVTPNWGYFFTVPGIALNGSPTDAGDAKLYTSFYPAWPVGSLVPGVAYNTLPGAKVIGLNFDATSSGIAGNASGRNLVVNALKFSEIGSVPEPGTLLMLGTGLIGVIGASRRRIGR